MIDGSPPNSTARGVWPSRSPRTRRRSDETIALAIGPFRTITQIGSVNRNYINVTRTMGTSKRQIYGKVILPAIPPGLLVVLRLNLFAHRTPRLHRQQCPSTWCGCANRCRRNRLRV